MSKSNVRRRHLPSRTRGVHPEDGMNPVAAFEAAASAEPKTLQLCAQAQRALDFAIGAEVKDEVLRGLEVMDVIPDPSCRRLRVVLGREPGTPDHEDEEVLRRLVAARGFLRARIAESIHRKRTPELVFSLLPQDTGEEGVKS